MAFEVGRQPHGEDSRADELVGMGYDRRTAQTIAVREIELEGGRFMVEFAEAEGEKDSSWSGWTAKHRRENVLAERELVRLRGRRSVRCVGQFTWRQRGTTRAVRARRRVSSRSGSRGDPHDPDEPDDIDDRRRAA